MDGDAVQLKVDITMQEGTESGAPQWQEPDWEGYPHKGSPGYLQRDGGYNGITKEATVDLHSERLH